MNRLSLATLVLMLPMALGLTGARAENWPQWRGPTGQGISEETGLPVEWSEDKGIRWKCPLPAWGNSTPAIWGDAVFVTTHAEDRDLLLMRIDKATGEIVWRRTVGTGTIKEFDGWGKKGERRRHQEFHREHNMATPSPVTDGERVVVHFGNGDLAAYDFGGGRLWRRNLQDDHGQYTIWWGHANSPVLCGDLVISVCMQDSCADLSGKPSPSYVVAHDKRTGEPVWYRERMPSVTAEPCDAYTTPLLWRRGNAPASTELVVFGGRMLDAYRPDTGEPLWRLPKLTGNRVIPTPITGHGMIYCIQGMREPLLAVRPGDATGELPRDAVQWECDRGTSDSPSPVLVGERLYMVADDGILTCLDALDGRPHFKTRLPGNYRASPVAADGRVYLLNTEGVCTVIGVGDRMIDLAENQLDDRTRASPAISDGAVFIRGHRWLYCISGE